MQGASGTAGSTGLADIRKEARRVAVDVAGPELERTDKEAAWPSRTISALKESGLMGLVVPRSAGGLGAGFRAMVAACEELGRMNPSAGLTFGMHSVGTACIAARATRDHRERYLEPIAAGEHVSTLAVSEPGTGVHFYVPGLQARQDDDHVILDGEKAFVTNAGHADSYVTSTAPFEPDEDPGRFNVLVVDKNTPGLRIGDPWSGLGMRGNSARNLHFSEARVPATNLLGEEGAQTWYVFEVIAPYFIVAMAGTYLGVATRAVDEVIAHLKGRVHAATGRNLGNENVLQHDVAKLWLRVEHGRHMLYHAAGLADAQDPGAVLALMGAKASLDEIVTEVTKGAMALGGGKAYGENGILALLHRDALASHVMAPTMNLLRSWVGRALLDVPLLQLD